LIEDKKREKSGELFCDVFQHPKKQVLVKTCGRDKNERKKMKFQKTIGKKKTRKHVLVSSCDMIFLYLIFI
jgi:hypothetical protein